MNKLDKTINPIGCGMKRSLLSRKLITLTLNSSASCGPLSQQANEVKVVDDSEILPLSQ